MPVGVERDVRLRVSEPPAHSEYVFAFGNQDRGVGVSQAVKLAPGTPAYGKLCTKPASRC